MIRTALLLVLTPLFTLAQTTKSGNATSSSKCLHDLIAAKKVIGKIYDSSKIILDLTEKDTAIPYLVDSISSFKYLNRNKIAFLCYFNDVSSDIKLGYAEINFSPYRTKLLILNDLLVDVKSLQKNDTRITYLDTKSHTRYNSSTFLRYKIISKVKSSALFSSTVKSRVLAFR